MVAESAELGLVRQGDEIILGGPSVEKVELDEMASAVTRIQHLIGSLAAGYGGQPVSSFVRDLGFSEEESHVLTWASSVDWGQAYCRGDIVRIDQGFKVLELNVGGCVGGMVDGAMPLLTGVRQLDDPLSAWAKHVIESGGHRGRGVILEDGKFPSPWGRYVRFLADALASAGSAGFELRRSFELSSHELSLHDADGPISWFYPVFFPSHVCETPSAYEAIRTAVESNKVAMPVPFGSTALGSKIGLASLWAMAEAGVLSEGDDRLIRSVVPRTLRLTQGNADEVIACQESWVLKPATGFGGAGVVVGRESSSAIWCESVATCLSGSRPAVVQEYVEPRAERAITQRFGGEGGDYLARFVWGVFTAGGRRCGTPLLRCKPQAHSAIINFASGAAIGPCPPM